MAAIFGFLLMVVGVLIVLLPKLLAYFVGGVFIFLGAGAVVIGTKMKSAVIYRRIDPGAGPEEYACQT